MGAVSSNVSGRNAGMGGATYRTLHQQHTVHADTFQKLQIQVDVQVPQLGHWYQCLKLAQCTVVAQLHNCTLVVAACDDLRLSGCPGRGQLAILGHWFPYHQCCHHCHHCHRCHHHRYQHCHVTSIIICKIHKTALILRRASLFNLFTQHSTETFTVKETRTRFKRKSHIE